VYRDVYRGHSFNLASLAFPFSLTRENSVKRPDFGDELVTSRSVRAEMKSYQPGQEIRVRVLPSLPGKRG
jgi:hypothetical protein